MGKKKKCCHGLLIRALAVGTIVAMATIAYKVRENNPEGVKDANGDGIVDKKDYLREVKTATKETYEIAKDFAKEKAPIVKEKATVAYEKAKDFTKEKAPILKEKLEDAFDDLKDKTKK